MRDIGIVRDSLWNEIQEEAKEQQRHIPRPVRVWNAAYRPFIMGGNVNAPLTCEVQATGPFDLGKGYEGYLIIAPNGKTFVAESITGAFVGPTLEEVRQDVAAADEEVMRKQIEGAKKQFERAEWVSAEVFWQAMRCLSSKERAVVEHETREA